MKYVVFGITEDNEYEASLTFPLYYVESQEEAKVLVEDLNHKYAMYTEQVRYFVHDIPSKEEWDALEAKEKE